MREFKLPDLGEGLTEAEIVEWHVAANDDIKLNQPLLSVETDKAVVEVPSPVTGRVISLHGEAGDVIPVGDVLARFELPGSDAPASEDAPGREDVSSSPEHDGAPAPQADGKDDAPGVVGKLPASALVMSDTTGSAAAGPKKQRVKAAPSVRALARELGVDLTQVEGSGPGGRITAKDVAKAAEAGRDAPPSPQGKRASRPQTREADSTPASATDEKLSGPRRAMFHSMTASHSEVALCTVMDDADIHHWESPRDFTPRLIRAMVAGARAEPRLNGTFSAETGVLSMSEDVHMGLAMETPHGLIVATIFKAGNLSLDELREEVARLKKAGADRTLKPEEVRGYTITLSNIAGGSSRYATPLMVPPTVGILGSGAAREEVVAVNGEIAIRRMLPLSLTFDHRCVAGADASRFLGAVVADLKLAS
ncbi:MAG: dihydrolipoamide acetyltransferase family protein [Gammaproteobacteria bacterium]|nr:dihydrolipoamide acetyltransferase family protein [Gammaproteobacteria bacterium]